jgi:hypothetical protein
LPNAHCQPSDHGEYCDDPDHRKDQISVLKRRLAKSCREIHMLRYAFMHGPMRETDTAVKVALILGLPITAEERLVTLGACLRDVCKLPYEIGFAIAFGDADVLAQFAF